MSENVQDILNEPLRDETNDMCSASSAYSNQPGHPPSLYCPHTENTNVHNKRIIKTSIREVGRMV